MWCGISISQVILALSGLSVCQSSWENWTFSFWSTTAEGPWTCKHSLCFVSSSEDLNVQSSFTTRRWQSTEPASRLDNKVPNTFSSEGQADPTSPLGDGVALSQYWGRTTRCQTLFPVKVRLTKFTTRRWRSTEPVSRLDNTAKHQPVKFKLSGCLLTLLLFADSQQKLNFSFFFSKLVIVRLFHNLLQKVFHTVYLENIFHIVYQRTSFIYC